MNNDSFHGPSSTASPETRHTASFPPHQTRQSSGGTGGFASFQQKISNGNYMEPSSSSVWDDTANNGRGINKKGGNGFVNGNNASTNMTNLNNVVSSNHRQQASQASNDLEPSATHLSHSHSPEMLIHKKHRGGGEPKLARPPKKHRFTSKLPSLPVTVKNHLVAVIAEFAGTFMFLFFAFGGTQVVNGPANAAAAGGGVVYAPNDAAKLLYISLSFGMSLMVTAWVFFRISGGLFNPAVTLGLAVVGIVNPLRASLVCVSQVLGSIAAAAVIDALTPGTLNVNTKLLDNNNTVLGMSLAQGLFMEMLMTAQLVFTVFMLAAEKHRATFIAPVGIGLSLFIGELMSVFYTGGSMNPARSFGPSVIEGFLSDHWVYWIGPILGSLLASGFYALAKAIKYETVNPGQDESGDGFGEPASATNAAGGPGLGLGELLQAENSQSVNEKPLAAAAGGSDDVPRQRPYVDGPQLEAGRA